VYEDTLRSEAHADQRLMVEACLGPGRLRDVSPLHASVFQKGESGEDDRDDKYPVVCGLL